MSTVSEDKKVNTTDDGKSQHVKIQDGAGVMSGAIVFSRQGRQSLMSPRNQTDQSRPVLFELEASVRKQLSSAAEDDDP